LVLSPSARRAPTPVRARARVGAGVASVLAASPSPGHDGDRDTGSVVPGAEDLDTPVLAVVAGDLLRRLYRGDEDAIQLDIGFHAQHVSDAHPRGE